MTIVSGTIGRMASSNMSFMAPECGIEVLKASPYDEGNTAVSSSEIRKLLQAGNVAEAAYLLTYPYQLLGHIVSGYKVGRTLDFPRRIYG